MNFLIYILQIRSLIMTVMWLTFKNNAVLLAGTPEAFLSLS